MADPAATMQDVTLAAAPLLASTIVVPPVGAMPFSVRVPVELLPPATFAGFSVIVFAAGGMTVSVPPTVAPLTVIAAVVAAETGVVVIIKVPDVVPAGMVHDTGFAAVLLLTSVSVKPPFGAGEPKVSVPWALLPPVTVVGAIVMPIAVGGFMLNVAAVVVPLAVILTDVRAATGVVVTLNEPLFAPPAIVQADAAAAALLLVKVIV